MWVCSNWTSLSEVRALQSGLMKIHVPANLSAMGACPATLFAAYADLIPVLVLDVAECCIYPKFQGQGQPFFFDRRRANYVLYLAPELSVGGEYSQAPDIYAL